ncbi:MAG: TraM recognition domain-containing protein [Pseudomonadota bacterium]|nr:TraM recognition domain-containing protein [Pseudomonadota bacterium]
MSRSRRGLSQDQEQDQQRLIRDVRPIGQRISDFFKEPTNVGYLILALGVLSFVFSFISSLIFLIIMISFIVATTQRVRLPFRMPMRSKEKDYGDMAPNGKPRSARGIYFFGNELDKKTELWFANEDMRTHCLIFGSTGSGKTESLVSIAYNALVQGSGFIYVDGKGDNSLFAKIFSLMKQMGREDDILLINFMTGARDIIGAQEKRMSNTMNPFASGSSSMLSNLVTSMLDSGSGGSDGDMWKGRAIAFVEALFKILVYQRDAGNILLDPDTIRNYFALERLEAIAADKVFIRDGQFDISLEGVPDVVMQPIENYLKTLPGYVKERKGKQVSTVFEQHGFITMQLTRTFTTFADTYGHIMRTKLAEVDLKDVVLNRRVLVVLLPALEKSPDELANLGKVVIASMKTMMAAGLGDAVEGTYQDVITRKPTSASTPFLCVLDEYGYYAVKGFAVVPAQARSLGFSVIFAGQDLPAFQKSSKEEAASIGANTNIKICMKLEDPTDTWEFFMKGAGESYVTAVESFSAQNPTITGAYSDTKSAKTEKRARIDLLDLKEQTEGQMHIFFKSKIIRASSFYVNPEPVKAMRLNVFVKVDLPKDAELYNLVKSIEDFEELTQHGLPKFNAEIDNDIAKAINIMQTRSKVQLPIDKGIDTLFEFHKQNIEAQDSTQHNRTEDNYSDHSDSTMANEDLETIQDAFIVNDDKDEIGNQQINFFTAINITQSMKYALASRNVESLCQPLIIKSKLVKNIEYLGKLTGQKSDTLGVEISDITGNIEANTTYNTEYMQSALDKKTLIAKIDQLIGII